MIKKGTLVVLLTLLCVSFVCAQSTPVQTASASPSPAPTAAPATEEPDRKDSKAKEPATAATPAPSKPDAAPSKSEPGAKPAAKKVVLPPEKAAPVSIPRFDKAPVIDGKLDDDIWKSAVRLRDFYQIDPGDNSPPSKQTEVLLGYDARTLYVAFVASDEPDKVRATVPRRDQIFNDDYVGFFFDTFNDQRRAYCIFFSPLGVQADGIMTEGRGEDYSVDIVMESKGALNDTGFVVEVAIPFKSLRYEAGKGKHWGAHFFRRIKRLNNELDSWMPFSRDVRGNMNQAGKLTGLEGIATERTLELIPSLTLSETGRRVRSFTAAQRAEHRALGLSPPDPGRFVNEPLTFDPGLTAKFGLSPQMTLDLALNPDFAQVEADQLVVTANQRFPIFYAERRPFFLENIDVFQTRITAVHTRAIVDPDVAVKLSGKQGRNSVGLILASDNAPGNFVGDERLNSNNFRFLDKNAYIGVLRVKRDIGKESSLGLLATTYNFIEKHNHVGGFDGRFKWDNKYVAEFQVLGTTSRRYFFDPNQQRSFNARNADGSTSAVRCPTVRFSTFSVNPNCDDYRTGNSLAYSYLLSRGTRRWWFELNGSGRTRDYRADVGFVQRTNTNMNGLYIGYYSEPKEKAKIISWYIDNFQHVNYDWQGRMQFW
ncbi:MAG TPA: DUF5916 domain-containing protein, partial [Pyrinomonadaceae bacterium]|nr:DUF5916 domain-containing protein [Pyrinomonadaceae bacterium]